MTSKPVVSYEELGRIPLLRGFADRQLDKLMALCEPAQVLGDRLFDEGAPAEVFYLLTSGSVSLFHSGEEIHKLYPIVIIGELGALAGRPRMSRAVVGDGYEVWQIRVTALHSLFADDSALALLFLQNLLGVVTDKIQRDQLRIQDMRSNIIHTQKDMKRMREFLLASTDTEVSAGLHQILEDNIARNRRINYRVEPSTALPAILRLGKAASSQVIQISRTHVVFAGVLGEVDNRVSGVLSLNGPEIPVSGKIAAVGEGQTEVEFDLLLDEYAAELEGYLTRMQMLDYLV